MLGIESKYDDKLTGVNGYEKYEQDPDTCYLSPADGCDQRSCIRTAMHLSGCERIAVYPETGRPYPVLSVHSG